MDVEFMFERLSDNFQYVAWQEYQVRRDNINTCAFVLLIVVHLPRAYVSLPRYIEITVIARNGLFSAQCTMWIPHEILQRLDSISDTCTRRFSYMRTPFSTIDNQFRVLNWILPYRRKTLVGGDVSIHFRWASLLTVKNVSRDKMEHNAV
jgi:hypothetical protein